MLSASFFVWHVTSCSERSCKMGSRAKLWIIFNYMMCCIVHLHLPFPWRYAAGWSRSRSWGAAALCWQVLHVNKSKHAVYRILMNPHVSLTFSWLVLFETYWTILDHALQDDCSSCQDSSEPCLTLKCSYSRFEGWMKDRKRDIRISCLLSTFNLILTEEIDQEMLIQALSASCCLPWSCYVDYIDDFRDAQECPGVLPLPETCHQAEVTRIL